MLILKTVYRHGSIVCLNLGWTPHVVLSFGGVGGIPKQSDSKRDPYIFETCLYTDAAKSSDAKKK